LNVLVPFGDTNYYAARPQLAIATPARMGGSANGAGAIDLDGMTRFATVSEDLLRAMRDDPPKPAPPSALAPAATPRDVSAKLHAAIVRTLQDTAIRNQFVNDGAEPIGSTPEQFASVISADLKKWQKVIRDAGIKLDG
jgi:hypothetical protein